MKEIVKRGMSALKDVLTYRCSGGIGAAGLKAILNEVEDFEALILHECAQQDERLARVLDENALLRGLVGVGESDMVPQLLRQGEELHALREQVLSLRALAEKLRQDNEMALTRVAVAEHERNNSRCLYEEGALQYKKELDALKVQLREFQDAARKEMTTKESAYEI